MIVRVLEGWPGLSLGTGDLVACRVLVVHYPVPAPRQGF
jgi:hypothetical protein